MFFTRKKADAVAASLNEFNQNIKPVSLYRDAWKRIKKNKMAFAGLIIVSIYFIISIITPVLPLYPYERQELRHTYLPPSFKKAGIVMIKTKEAHFAKLMKSEGRSQYTQAEQDELAAMRSEIETDPVHNRVYILGTDILGRDLLSRAIYGGRISLGIGLVGTITALIIGIFWGAVAGYSGGKIDIYMMRIVDVIYGLPYMMVVIVFMALFGGRSVYLLFIAIAMVSWLTISRVVRGQIISLRNSEFVEAAKASGAGTPRIILKHLLPNTLGIIIVYSSLSFPGFIMSESFLSFLGLGVSAPMSSWGSMIDEGVKAMEMYPWLLLVPAFMMTIFLFAMNFLGDGLRDAFDPQGKNRN